MSDTTKPPKSDPAKPPESDPTEPPTSNLTRSPTSKTAETPTSDTTEPPTGGPTGELPELDPVIHAQARLRVVSALSQLREADSIAFPRLQEILRVTAGNLSVHLRKLEDAGYVEVVKTHRGRTPATLVRLTRRGRLAFDDYVIALRALLNHPEES